MDGLVKVEVAARLVGRDRRQIYKWIKRGYVVGHEVKLPKRATPILMVDLNEVQFVGDRIRPGLHLRVDENGDLYDAGGWNRGKVRLLNDEGRFVYVDKEFAPPREPKKPKRVAKPKKLVSKAPVKRKAVVKKSSVKRKRPDKQVSEKPRFQKYHFEDWQLEVARKVMNRET